MDETQAEKKPSGGTNEHLANERTFLAWVRTGIAAISLGFVIARFNFWLREIAISSGQAADIPHTGLSLPIGLGMVAFGALMTLLATWRYRAIRDAINQEREHPGQGLILLTAAVVVLLALVLVVYLLATARQF